MNTSERLRPLLAAATAAFFYWAALNFLVVPVRFLGGEMIAITITPLLAASLSGAFAMAVFESRSLGDLGLAWRDTSSRNFGIGLMLGIGGACLAVVPAVVLGLASFQSVTGNDYSWRSSLFTPLLLLCGAAGEEIAFRGFVLQSLMRAYGAWASILGVGALFGLLHATNPSATTLSVMNTAGFGALFGLALLRSHDLWFPIGIHFGWNATLPFFGVQLSGLTIRVTGYKLVWKAGELWSGGNYGPEASLLATLVLVVLFVTVFRLRLARGWAFLLDSQSQE